MGEQIGARAVLRGYLGLLDWRLGAVMGLCLLGLLFVAQIPFTYSFMVGRERGQASDLPYLRGFNPPEMTATDSWRWSKGQAAIEMPAVGRRAVIASFDIVAHRGQRSGTPTTLTLQSGEQTIQLALRREGARYRVYLPPTALPDGALRLRLSTETWHQPGDRRELGVALGDAFTVTSTRSVRLVLPDMGLLLGWPLGLGLCWLALRVMGFNPQATLLIPALGVPLLALAYPPRLGFGSLWAVQIGGICLLGATLTTWLLPRVLQHAGLLPSPAILRWLLLLLVASFALKYGGRLYPDSMPGDIGLHDNRYQLTISGHVFIRAQHRGLPFPFPPALYLLAAPLSLSGLPIRTIFELLAGLFEASTVVMLYLLLARVTGSTRLGLLAGAIYALTAGGFMTTWFAFQTHVSTQWFFIALLLLLVWRWPHYDDWLAWGLLTLLLAQVFLGHIGLFLNAALLGLLLVPALWWRARSAAQRRAIWAIAGAGLAAGLFCGLFYYSAFAQLAAEQVVGTATQGLNEITGKQPIPRATSLRVLWEGGLITHFGFFPVLLACAGGLLLHPRHERAAILRPLLWLTFVVSASQAMLPFITLSSITTRWLMFSVWAIAVAGALGLDALWHRGRSGRLIGLAMAGYVLWITIGVWIDAALLRKPPIEPF